MSMKIVYQNVTVSGIESSRRFVPLHSETGVMASSESVRVTGERSDAVVVEVREAPASTVTVNDCAAFAR